VFKCRDVPELATDYVEGALNRRTRLAMRLHLLICRMCRAYMGQLARTQRLLGRQTMPPPAHDVEEKLVSAAADQR
jgi:predicted anti-sigma-YlaC factor YlaD